MNETFNADSTIEHHDQARKVMDRLKSDPLFMQLVNHIWPTMTKEEAFAKADKVNTNMDFQLEFMHQAIRVIIERSSVELTCSGFENIDPTKAYLFIANHRDILLDSSILQVLLVEHGFSTSEISFGDNLMKGGFISDFGKLNRMFTIPREGNNRELYEISQKLSAYIRNTVVEKNVSVWIAQRNGRTKDGNDCTQTGLLKMLNMSGGADLSENMRQLQIVPLCISYEYEPCDDLKVQELYSSLETKYVKSPGEDLNSILTGILQKKGRIHMSVGKPIDHELVEIKNLISENEKIKQLANVIDEQLYSGYRLWPGNYIASDIVNGSDEFSSRYTAEDKKHFLDYVQKKIAKLNGEPQMLFNLFINMYSNPVKVKKAVLDSI